MIVLSARPERGTPASYELRHGINNIDAVSIANWAGFHRHCSCTIAAGDHCIGRYGGAA